MTTKFNHCRARNWCFTAYEEPNIEKIYQTEKVNYIVFQKEKCPKTDREHWQGYFEVSDDAISLRQAIKILGLEKSPHVEPRRGTQEQAISYCKKEESRAGEPKELGRPKQQGKRSDVDEMYQDIKDGHTLKEILENHQGNALRMIHALEKGAMIYHGFNNLDKWILYNRIEDKDEVDETIIKHYEKKLRG